MYVVNGKYVIRSNLDNTILINIENSDESLFFDGVAKIIIDNINLRCEEIVLLLKKFFPNEETERLKKRLS